MSSPSQTASEPSRPWRTGAKIATAIACSSAVTAIVMFVAVLRADGAFDPPPPLVASAGSGEVSAMDARFDRAVRERFPIGSLESKLILDLVTQGFKPGWGGGLDGRTAIYKEFPVVCANEYTVHWRVDATSRLTKVSGDFRAICL